jgi:hypothetical protein
MAGSERGKGREEHGTGRRPVGAGTDGWGGTNGGVLENNLITEEQPESILDQMGAGKK